MDTVTSVLDYLVYVAIATAGLVVLIQAEQERRRRARRQLVDQAKHQVLVRLAATVVHDRTVLSTFQQQMATEVPAAAPKLRAIGELVDQELTKILVDTMRGLR